MTMDICFHVGILYTDAEFHKVRETLRGYFTKFSMLFCNLLKHLMQQPQRNTEVNQSSDLLCNISAKYILVRVSPAL